MRVTLNLPDDVQQAARLLAKQRRISVGAALGELARHGIGVPGAPVPLPPFPTFQLPPGTAPITLEQTLAAEDGLDAQLSPNKKRGAGKNPRPVRC